MTTSTTVLEWVNALSFHSPWIISTVVAVLLFTTIPKYGLSFLFFFMVNNFINEHLKTWIREPRPSGSQTMMREQQQQQQQYTEAHKFGMPSGHAQLAFYALSFYSQTVKMSLPILLGMMFLAGMTLWHQWKYKNHSCSQLAAGTVLGSLIGISAVEITKQGLRFLPVKI